MLIATLCAGTFDLFTRTWTPVDASDGLFCAGQTIASDGSIVVAGGHKEVRHALASSSPAHFEALQSRATVQTRLKPLCCNVAAVFPFVSSQCVGLLRCCLARSPEAIQVACRACAYSTNRKTLACWSTPR